MKLIIALLISAILLFGCTTAEEESDDKMGVVVTIIPQQEFVEEIGGDLVDVTVLVPAGASPHTYEPTTFQMREVANAELYIMVGSGVEFELEWSDKIVQTNSNLTVINSSSAITLLEAEETELHEEGSHEEEEAEHGEGGEHEESEEDHEEDEREADSSEEHSHDEDTMDPHVWTSPKNVKLMAKATYDALIAQDPSNKDTYKKNYDDYIARLDSLDANITSSVATMKTKKFLIFHPAFGYFAKDYGLEQIAIEEDGKEPTASGLASVVSQAKSNNITVVFASPQYSTTSANTIADEIGGSVVLVDPLAKDYIDNMAKIAMEISSS